MHHALRGAQELARQGEQVRIISDSQLAICTTTGAWASRKHKLLAANNRKALARLREGGTTVPYTSGTPVRTLAMRSTRGQTSWPFRGHRGCACETAGGTPQLPQRAALSQQIQCQTSTRWGGSGQGRGEGRG